MTLNISKYRILSLIIALPFLSVYLYHSLVVKKETQQIEQQMYEMLSKIEPPQNSTFYKTRRYHKATNALVYSDYYSDLKDDEIISHYQQKLQDNDWNYCCNDDDQINKELIFQKDEFTAHLYIKKERSKNTKTYRISIAYNLEGCQKCK